MNKLQNTYVLPNKLFEYMMAGLAVCVSATPEMIEVVRGFNTGVLIDNEDPTLIAKVVNSLQRESIDNYKRNSLIAARKLNWERESEQLIAAYGQAMSSTLRTSAAR